MIAINNLSAESACFEEELSESEWISCSDFEKEDQNERLFCNGWAVQGSKQSKPRRCPIALCVYKDRELYLQQHGNCSITIALPDICDLGVPVFSQPRLEQVTPIARHGQDHYLLHFKLKPKKCESEQVCYLFLAVSSEGGELAVFSTEPLEFLDILASAQGTGCDPPLACLVSYHEQFHRSNVCHVQVYRQGCRDETSDSECQVLKLTKTHTIPVFISGQPQSILPMLLFHPLNNDKLVFFHVNAEQLKRVSEAWMSDYSLQAKTHKKQLNLFAMLEEMAVTKPEFQNAQFSPDGHVIVVSFSLTDMFHRGLQSVAVLLIHSHSYQSLKKIVLPEHVSLCSGNWNDRDKLMCFKSYTPVFSKCGQKMAVGRNLGDKACVYIYRIPVSISLQSQCRRVIRKHGIRALALPPIIRKYLEFS